MPFEIRSLIPREQHQTVLLEGKRLEDVDKFKYLDSMLDDKWPWHRGDQEQDNAYPVRILSLEILSLVAA